MELLKAIKNKNIEKVKLILENSTKNKKILNLNEIKDKDGYYPLLLTIYVKLLIEYALNHNISLEYDENYEKIENNSEIKKLLEDYEKYKKDPKKVKFLMDYAEHHYAEYHYVNLKINDKNNDGIYAFLNAMLNNNIEIAKLLIEYVEKNDIILNINKQNVKKDYPVDLAIRHNNIEMIKLLIEYSNNNNNNIPLDIAQKNVDGNFPIISALDKNVDIEILKLLVEYAKNKQIILYIDENQIKN
eukprot:jgi/Orpsp1_1/1192518/evm.model.d7180000093936.1